MADLLTQTLPALARHSFVQPRETGRALIALGLPMAARWMLLALAIIIGTLLLNVAIGLMDGLSDATNPLFLVAAQFVGNVIVAGALTVFGRLFGGYGRFPDALLIVGWLQLLMVAVQVVQLFALIFVPFLNVFVVMGSFVLLFWLITGFIQALHGFNSPALVLLGTFAGIFVLAFIVSIILMMAGVDPIALQSPDI